MMQRKLFDIKAILNAKTPKLSSNLGTGKSKLIDVESLHTEVNSEGSLSEALTIK